MPQNSKNLEHLLDIQQISKELAESTIFYKHLAEVSPEAVVVHSGGNIIYANPASLSLVEAKNIEEVIGQPVMRFVHPDSIPLIQQRIKTMLNKQVVAPAVEEKFISLKGKIFIAETKAVPFSFMGRPAILAILHDITARKKAEERQKFLEDISMHLGASIDYKTTLKSICKLLVPAFADYLRIVLINSEKQIEEVAAHHTDPKKLSLVKKLYDAYKGRAEAVYGVEHILHSGKSEIMERVSPQFGPAVKSNMEVKNIISVLGLASYMGVPLKLGSKVIGVITFSSTQKEHLYTTEDLQFAEEIAARIAYAVDNARLYTAAQKAIALREEFISLASHELKTPVTSLKVYMQTLAKQFEKRGDTTLSSYFERMDRQTNKLTSLVNDLLNVSKIQHGKLEFEKEYIDLDLLVKNTVEELQETTRKHRIYIEGSIAKRVYADQYRIYQVLTNLLTNAIKYSPNADKVIVRLESGKDVAVVIVQDFGIGIAPDQQKKIFTQFYRVTNPDERTYPGLGIGLYISSEIIKRHSGVISVVSDRGKGSQFSFTLPYIS